MGGSNGRRQIIFIFFLALPLKIVYDNIMLNVIEQFIKLLNRRQSISPFCDIEHVTDYFGGFNIRG
jgi:transposase